VTAAARQVADRLGATGVMGSGGSRDGVTPNCIRIVVNHAGRGATGTAQEDQK
jgi:hypothetical protein